MWTCFPWGRNISEVSGGSASSSYKKTAKKKVVAKKETPSPTTNTVTSLKFYKTNEQAQLPTFATPFAIYMKSVLCGFPLESQFATSWSICHIFAICHIFCVSGGNISLICHICGNYLLAAFKDPLRKLHYKFTTFPSFATYEKPFLHRFKKELNGHI